MKSDEFLHISTLSLTFRTRQNSPRSPENTLVTLPSQPLPPAQPVCYFFFFPCPYSFAFSRMWYYWNHTAGRPLNLGLRSIHVGISSFLFFSIIWLLLHWFICPLAVGRLGCFQVKTTINRVAVTFVYAFMDICFSLISIPRSGITGLWVFSDFQRNY